MRRGSSVLLALLLCFVAPPRVCPTELFLEAKASATLQSLMGGGGTTWTGSVAGDKELEELTIGSKIDNCGSRENIEGTLPSSAALWNLPKLTFLRVTCTKLTGTLPAMIGTLRLLEEADFERNPKITGTIPHEFGLLANLEYIDFMYNSKLSGYVWGRGTRAGWVGRGRG